jgi:hypothetical protein
VPPHKLGVGHENVQVVVRRDARRPHPDIAHLAGHARLQIDEVADTKMTFEQDDQAGGIRFTSG